MVFIPAHPQSTAGKGPATGKAGDLPGLPSLPWGPTDQAGPAHLSLPVDETKTGAGTRGGTREPPQSDLLHPSTPHGCVNAHNPTPTHTTHTAHGFHMHSTQAKRLYLAIYSLTPRVSLSPHPYSSTAACTQHTQGHRSTCMDTNVEQQKPMMVSGRLPEFKSCSHHFSM